MIRVTATSWSLVLLNDICGHTHTQTHVVDSLLAKDLRAKMAVLMLLPPTAVRWQIIFIYFSTKDAKSASGIGRVNIWHTQCIYIKFFSNKFGHKSDCFIYQYLIHIFLKNGASTNLKSIFSHTEI